MYWTNFVRNFCKVGMICGVIASIVIGCVILEDSITIGIIVMCAGSMLFVVGISFTMMVCEMSESLNELNCKMDKLTKAKGETTPKSNNPPPVNVARSNQWKCVDCGNINPIEAKFCRECGRPK